METVIAIKSHYYKTSNNVGKWLHFKLPFHAFFACQIQGIGITEEEAIEKLKEQIDSYNKSSIQTEKRMRLEKIVNNLFPKDRF